jgi:hypothetical protein
LNVCWNFHGVLRICFSALGVSDTFMIWQLSNGTTLRSIRR